jgi:hypothetical protein
MNLTVACLLENDMELTILAVNEEPFDLQITK